MGRVENAVALFRGGCACSQAILAAYGPEQGLERDQAMRVSAGFAGGMRLGETCGAVTGAFMVLGLRFCEAGCELPGGRQKIYAAVGEFASHFTSRNSSISCKELLGCDISTADGMQRAKEGDLFRTVCPKMVQDAAEILDKMIN